MSRRPDDDDSAAGWGCLLLIVAIAAVVAAAMSLAALVDPFDWYPSFETLWAECDDDGTERDECAYAQRFPGFWWHLLANLAYTAGAMFALLRCSSAVAELRRSRATRLSSTGAYAAYREARASLTGSASIVAALATLPIAVALA